MKQICKECCIKKDLVDFYHHPQGKNGVLGRCKECIKNGRRSDREREMARIWEKEKRIRPDGYVYNTLIEYRKNNPEKYSAQIKVGNLLRRNKINFNCSICGCSSNIELHHEDYSKPYDIIPLCALHHKQYHNSLDKIILLDEKMIVNLLTIPF